MCKRLITILLITAGVVTAIVSFLPALAATKSSPTPAAKTSFQYSGWVPYWKKSDGISDLAFHIGRLDVVNPFSYEVKADGTLIDKAKLTETPWPELFAASRLNGGKIIPTVAWLRGAEIHALLTSSTLRVAHEDAILKMVLDNNYDGVDIDYENKKAETKSYFSLFLKGLASRLHKNKKILSCTIEPRTPAADRFTKIPKDLEYANDYKVINAQCDQVRIMAYDQAAIDLKLNQAKGRTNPYVPVADPVWVEKVIKETLQTISRKKVWLGIPTYGYEYKLSTSTPYTYSRLQAVNFVDAQALAIAKGLVPVRNAAGELSFTYASGTPRIVWYSDSRSVADKIALAKKYKLAGAAIFKIDGGADPFLWSTFQD